MSIGKNIAALRKAKGWTQSELGEMLGVSNQAVSKWESEMTMPDVILLPDIAKVFGVTMEELYSTYDREMLEVKAPEFEDNRVLRVCVENKNEKVKTSLPVAALRTLFEAMATPDLDTEEKMLFQALERMFDSNGTLVDVDSEDEKVKITIENYEDQNY